MVSFLFFFILEPAQFYFTCLGTNSTPGSTFTGLQVHVTFNFCLYFILTYIVHQNLVLHYFCYPQICFSPARKSAVLQLLVSGLSTVSGFPLLGYALAPIMQQQHISPLWKLFNRRRISFHMSRPLLSSEIYPYSPLAQEQ